MEFDETGNLAVPTQKLEDTAKAKELAKTWRLKIFNNTKSLRASDFGIENPIAKGKRIEIVLSPSEEPGKEPSWKKYKIVLVSKEQRHFFPGYKMPFKVDSDIGVQKLKVTSASRGTLIGDPKAGGYLSGLGQWFKKHPELEPDDVIIFEAIEPGKRYKIYFKDSKTEIVAGEELVANKLNEITTTAQPEVDNTGTLETEDYHPKKHTNYAIGGVEMRESSLEAAIMQIFKSDPTKLFEIQEVYTYLPDYYELSDFQKELDPNYPQPRYYHEVRSIIVRLETQGKITKVGKNKRKLAYFGGMAVLTDNLPITAIVRMIKLKDNGEQTSTIEQRRFDSMECYRYYEQQLDIAHGDILLVYDGRNGAVVDGDLVRIARKVGWR